MEFDGCKKFVNSYKMLVSVRKNEILKPAYEMAVTREKPSLETCKLRAKRNSALLNRHPKGEEMNLQDER